MEAHVMDVAGFNPAGLASGSRLVRGVHQVAETRDVIAVP